MASTTFSPTSRTKLNRLPRKGVYDRDLIYAVLDEAMICHVAMTIEGDPCVLPTIHTRVGDVLYLHGSNHNRMFQHLAQGATACLSVTILDGLVLARSGLHHSMNHRSVVLYCQGTLVTDREEKLTALEALVEQIIPGRWEDSRQPTEQELNATSVVALPITEASAKVRTGPPVDDDRDRELPIWAGEIPVKLCAGEPVTDTQGLEVPLPDYVANYSKIPPQRASQ